MLPRQTSRRTSDIASRSGVGGSGRIWRRKRGGRPGRAEELLQSIGEKYRIMSIRVLSRLAARRWIFPAEAAAAVSSTGSSFPAANYSASSFFMASSRPAAEKGARHLHTFTKLIHSPTPRYTIPALVALATFASCSAYVYLRDKRAPEEATEEAPEEAHEASPDDKTVKTLAFLDEAVRWDKWDEFYNSKDDLPDYINWVEAGAVTPVMDQAATDSCSQCAAVAAVEGIYQIKTGKLVRLSVQQLVDCMGYGCIGGSTTPAAFRYMSKAGCVSKVDYPFTGSCGPCEAESFPVAVRIDGYFYFPATEEGLMRAVAMQPVMVDVYCNNAFLKFRGGRTLELTDCEVGEVPDEDQLHCVLVVAYGEDAEGKYWLIKNSWSEEWGDKGFAKLRPGVADSRGWGVAGITSVEGHRNFYLPVID